MRVTNLEESVSRLDERTKLAQRLSLHGDFLPNLTEAQRYLGPRSVQNATPGMLTTYYGATAPAGQTTGVDPLVAAYMATDDSNNPLTYAESGIQIRQDSRFALAYQVDDNLTVSLPVHILNFEWGGEFTQQSKFDIEPSIDLELKRAGAIDNLTFKFGLIDNLTSSRTGLTFRAPFGYSDAVPYEEPLQPYQKGIGVKGTIGEAAFGLTDFEASFTRVDDVLIDTQPGVTDPSVLAFGANAYFFPIVPPQTGFTQSGPASALKTDSFNAGSGTLAQAFLSAKAVTGSVYLSSFDGQTFDSSGRPTGGPPLLAAAPGFTYNDAYNAVVFSAPLPPRSVVGITYRALGTTSNAAYQRYMVHARANQSFKGSPDAQIGVTFNRVFDVGNAFASDQNAAPGASPTGYGQVSDTVLGIDFEAPLPLRLGAARPIAFGEMAASSFTPVVNTVVAADDSAGVFGLRLKLRGVELSAQYQSVGPNFLSGAPLRYYGNVPPLLASYGGTYLPDFFGFANNLAINQQFDAAFTRLGIAPPYASQGSAVGTAGNPNLTYLFPVFNPFRASGPELYSAFAPNSEGLTLSLGAPVRAGALVFDTRAQYQHLEEVRPSAFGSAFYGLLCATNRPLKYDTYTLGTLFALPAFGEKITTDLSATYETLQRLDATRFPYVPVDPGTQTFDATSASAAAAAFGPAGSPVAFYPNYVNLRHVVISASASMPLGKSLVLNGTYSTQRYGGEYGTTLTQNISQRKDYYTGSLTYNIPNTNSSLSFLPRHYGYSDEVVPNANLGENRQDFDFTVRF